MVPVTGNPTRCDCEVRTRAKDGREGKRRIGNHGRRRTRVFSFLRRDESHMAPQGWRIHPRNRVIGGARAGAPKREGEMHVCATHATGTAERDAAVLLLEASASPGSTVGADKGYDVARFVADVRVQDVTPHVTQKVRGSAIDGRTTRHAGYHVSQRKRKLVEQVFGWMKTVGGLRKLRHRGIALVDWQLTFAATAYNLVRLRNLEARCP